MDKPSTQTQPSSSPDQWAEQLAVRVARSYYELGMTQQQIASELSIGRARVIRLLSEARERGIVTIRINSPLLENVTLAEALAEQYGLAFAHVCLSHASDERALAQQVGAAAGPAVLEHFHDNMVIGLGWGVTLKAFSTQIDHKSLTGASVVSLLGSLTRRSSITRFEATTALAAKLDAECLYLPSPIICDSEESRRVITAQPMFQEIYQLALRSDLAVVSIGGLDSNTIREVNLIDDKGFRAVRRQGAIGNFLGYYIDANADVIDHPVNSRIIGIGGAAFQPIPKRILISAGHSKAMAMKAVLGRGLCTGLVTDQQTARLLLE